MSKSFEIKDIFADHWDVFLNEGYPIRPTVLINVDKIMKCGEPSMGHAIYSCDYCGNIKHLFFTCKRRFSNSCGSNYI